MKPTELKSLIKSRFKANIKRVLHIESSPGLGKTQIAKQAAKELGISCLVIHAPLMQPEDYGFPVISQDRSNVSFIVSKDKFPMQGSGHPEQGILLIDELTQCDASGQKILAQLLQEREIHGQQLLPGWMIVATGNRVIDRAGAIRTLSHLKNRITTVELDASLPDWCDWALSNEVKTEVISFIRFRPNLLSNFDPQADVNATPRAWAEGVSAALGVVDPTLEFPVFKGDVGEGPAAEFTAFLKIYRNLPDIDKIIATPDKVKIPEGPSGPATLYALCGALAERVTTDVYGSIMRYINRMPAEFTVLFVRDAIRRVPDIQSTAAFIDWAKGPGAKLLT